MKDAIKNLVIAGAGAAGMIAAIQAAETAADYNLQLNITLLEKLPRPGKKLLATGNGRCNIANAGAARSNYFNAAGQNPAFVQPALQKFSQKNNLTFFRSMGLLTKQEEKGRLYPMGDQAAAVLDCLRLRLMALGEKTPLKLLAPAELQGIRPLPEGGFALTGAGIPGEIKAEAVVLALGGLASPQLSSSQGFAGLLQPLGLKPTRLYPALTQIKIASPLPKALQGIKLEGRVSLWQRDSLLGREEGEVLFASYGLSGPPILQLSRLVSQNFYEQPQPQPQTIKLDLLPGLTFEELLKNLEFQRSLPLTLENFLTGLLNKRLGQQLIKLLSHSLPEAASSLTAEDLRRLAQLIKELPLPVRGVTGWERAQVMAGGLPLKAFDSQTLACRRLPGLFAAGELLDVCGECGGYNLSWAWSSGRLAAVSAVKYLAEN